MPMKYEKGGTMIERRRETGRGRRRRRRRCQKGDRLLSADDLSLGFPVEKNTKIIITRREKIGGPREYHQTTRNSIPRWNQMSWWA